MRSHQGRLEGSQYLLWSSEMVPMLCPACPKQCRYCDRLSRQHAHAAGRQPGAAPAAQWASACGVSSCHGTLVGCCRGTHWCSGTLQWAALLTMAAGSPLQHWVCTVPSTEVDAMCLALSHTLDGVQLSCKEFPSTCSSLPSTLPFLIMLQHHPSRAHAKCPAFPPENKRSKASDRGGGNKKRLE